MFENTFKNIDDILHKDAGCGSELDYVEQSSWVLFLKYLDDLEVAAAACSGPMEGRRHSRTRLLFGLSWCALLKDLNAYPY